MATWEVIAHYGNKKKSVMVDSISELRAKGAGMAKMRRLGMWFNSWGRPDRIEAREIKEDGRNGN